MRALLVCLALALMGAADAARAAESLWVEAVGHGFVNDAADKDAARRRALADALLDAALKGGAEVRGHTMVDKSVVVSDLAIIRPVGRVLEHEVIGESLTGDMWEVRLRARVGAGGEGQCQTRRNLIVTAYAPNIHVSPNAPAWAAPVAMQVANDLVDQLDRHSATKLVRVTDRPLPGALGRGGEAFDYVALTKGSVRTEEGDYGFVADISMDVRAEGGRPMLELALEMQLVSGTGQISRQVVTRQVALPQAALLPGLAELGRKSRIELAGDLTHGLKAELSALLDVKSCEPVTAAMTVAGKTITVNVGRAHGLSKASLAFTTDADNTMEILEIVQLGQKSATLRPLDGSQPISAYAGRSVRFVEAGL